MPQLMEKSQVGVRESLADLIVCAESDVTPYIAMAKKGKKPGKVTHDWQVKAYLDGGHVGVLDGKDATEFVHNPRERLHGVSQKLWHNPAVSDFAEESDVAGLKKGEGKGQVADALISLSRKMEKRMLSAEDCKLEAAPAVPNETRGIFSWLSATAQALYPVPEAYRPTDTQIYTGTLANFKESSLIAMATAAYKQRKGKANVKGIVGIDLKNAFTNFSKYSDDVANKTNVRTFQSVSGDKSIISTIDRVTLDSGTIDLMLSSFLYTDPTTGNDTAYTHKSGVFLDTRMIELLYTRMPRTMALPYAGGGYKWICDTIVMHTLQNPVGMFAATINS